MKKLVLLSVVTMMAFAACQKIKSIANINFNIPFSQTAEVPAIDGYTYGIPMPPRGSHTTLPSG